MFNPWSAANPGNAGGQSPRFPMVQPWSPFFSQPNWLNPGAPVTPGFNFNMVPPASIPRSFLGGLPGFPQAQPPPPPPNTAPPPEPPRANAPPPPPPGHPSGIASPRTMDFEKEWQKYQDSLQAEPTSQNQSKNLNATENPQLQAIIEEENKFNEQFNEWKKQCDSWKEMNKSHPDKQLYHQYEQQWQQYEQQMLEKQNEIKQRKEQMMRSLQPQAHPQSTHHDHLSMPQPPTSFSNWNMPERPQNSQSHPNVSHPSQNWIRPGGKGEQVNFGQDINQRFQSTGQLHRPNMPQSEQRPTWQRHQRPLLDNPVEPQGPPRFMPRPQGNRFSPNHGTGSRMANLRFRPPEPNPHVRQPWPRTMPGPSRPVAPRFPASQESPVMRGQRDGKSDPSQRPSLLGAPPLSRLPPRPLLSDPNSFLNKRSFEETPPRLLTPRRPPLLPHGNEFEPDQKRIRTNAPDQEPKFSMNLPTLPPPPQQSPRKRFIHPPFAPRPPLQMGNAPEFQPRLQMMGPRFRRQGAAAVSQEFQSRSSDQGTAESVQQQRHQQRESGSFKSHGINNADGKSDAHEEINSNLPSLGGRSSIEENRKEDVVVPGNLASCDETKVIEGDKLAASSSNATNYRPTDPKPVGESQMDAATTSPNKASEVLSMILPAVPQENSNEITKIPGRLPTDVAKGAPEWHATPECDRKRAYDGEGQWTGSCDRDSDLREDQHFYEDKQHGEAGNSHHAPWESDQDWRDGGWSKNWNREPVVHDYQHQCTPYSAEGMQANEDKDERYPSGVFHLTNNPYVATVIDYGHGGLEQDPHLISSRGFQVPLPSIGTEEIVFKHDQDFRTPPFFNRNPDFVPPPVHGPPPPPVPQRLRSEEPIIEKIPIETLILPPGRAFRPDHLVIMVRGLPGAGKTYISKLIKEREIKEGGTAPRLLCLDDYFITEVEKVIEEPETGKKVKKMVMEYEYDRALETSYKASFLKSFKKHVDDLYFTFIIVDATFDKKLYMDEFWNYAKSKGFQVYIIEVEADVNTCAKRNDHQRTLADIQKIKDGWDETPRHYLQLDAQFLLHGNIEEVEMDNSSAILEAEVGAPGIDQEDKDDVNEPGYQKSKWELDTSEQHLDKLDGLKTTKKVMTLEEYLQVPEDYEERSSMPGKKRVRWADIEEKKGVERMRKLGFVVGYTDWDKLNDDSCIEKALIKTKYI